MGAREQHRSLQPGQFPVRAEIPARFSDLDTLRHVNNVAVAGIFAEGRNILVRKFFERSPRPDGLRYIVGQVGITYLDEAHYPATFEIASGILTIGTSSFRIGQGFFYKGQCTSVAETVMVGTIRNRSCVIAEPIREIMETMIVPAERFPRLLI